MNNDKMTLEQLEVQVSDLERENYSLRAKNSRLTSAYTQLQEVYLHKKDKN